MNQEFSDELLSMASDLEVNLNNVFHFFVIGNIEIISEIATIGYEDINHDSEFTESEYIDFLKNKYLLINPIRIRRDEFRTIDGVEQRELFTVLNFSTDNVFYEMNPVTVITKGFPSEETIFNYLSVLNEIYFPYDIELSLDNDNDELIKADTSNNIIDFSKYI